MSRNNPALGLQHLLGGFKLALSPGLRRFVLIPFLVNVIIFSLLVWLGIDQFGVFMDWAVPEDAWYSFLRWLLWPLFAVAALLIIFFTFTAIANLIAAPFNALLAEKAELKLGGQLPSGSSSMSDIMKSIIPAMMSELRKLAYFLLRAIPILLLFLIPVVNIAASVLWIIFGAWFMTIEYADYPMGNHDMSFPQQLASLRASRWSSLGFGGSVMLLMMIPLVNFLAMPAAVCGATLFWHKELASKAALNPAEMS